MTVYTPQPMDRAAVSVVILILATLGASQSCARSIAAESIEVSAPEQRVWARPAAPRAEVAEPPRASLDLPDSCRRLVVREVEREVYGRIVVERRIGKVRATSWMRDEAKRWQHQQDLRRLIYAIGDELGADRLASEMVWRKAIMESSGDAANVHVMNEDIRANRGAASKGRARAADRWKRARVPVYQVQRGRLRKVGTHDAWSLGRGLYGQVTGLHMHRWSADAPPWSLCDPIVATVTVFWAMRAGIEECRGSTLRDAYRRFSSGKCAIREDELEARFDRLARGKVRGLRLDAFDPDAPAVLGDRWDESSADREIMLAVMRERVAERRSVAD